MKTKKVLVEVYGKNLELQVHQALSAEEYEDDQTAGFIESTSLFTLEEKLCFVADGKKFDSDSVNICRADIDEDWQKNIFGEGEGQIDPQYSESLDAEEFMEANNSDYGLLVWYKSYGEVEVEIPENEEFDPSKVTLLTIDWIFEEGETEMVVAFIYDGKAYTIEEQEGSASFSRVMCGENPNDHEIDFDDDEWDEDEENDEEDENED